MLTPNDDLRPIYDSLKSFNGVVLLAYRDDSCLRRVPLSLYSFEQFIDGFLHNQNNLQIHSGENLYLEIESIDLYPI
jgi:hypothetical protein